jgi:hypothetical protein
MEVPLEQVERSQGEAAPKRTKVVTKEQRDNCHHWLSGRQRDRSCLDRSRWPETRPQNLSALPLDK